MTIKVLPETRQFIQSLEKATIQKTLRTIDLLEKFGFILGMPHSRRITNKLFELRVRGQQEVRIFYALGRPEAILLHGFVKKTEKTPIKEIKTALSRL